jgi:diguanylate cyclase (GGDEF)-like protein
MGDRADGLRLFGRYALATALPIVLLGLGLARMYQSQMDHRALEQAISEAHALVQAGIEPHLGGRDLGLPLLSSERAGLTATTTPLLDSGSVLRLRLRDSAGHVVFDAAHPRGGTQPGSDDEAAEAATGRVVRRLTHLNSDQVDARNHVGARAVEVYLPVHAGGASQQIVGVLEIYLPYGPIARSVAASERSMLVLIVLGLAALWGLLSAISWSVTRRLRRTADTNEYLALHDTLTGLPNRTLFGDRASHAIAAAGRSGQSVAIAVVDIDRFKEVNDTLGHQNGDAFLRHVAESLLGLSRPGDTVARLGGDEFGLVLQDVDSTIAREVCERLEHALSVEVELGGVPVSAEASIGVAIWPDHGTEMDELLQCADLAMYAAKESRARIVEYSTELEHFSPARLALVSQLRRAIGSDELVLHYQPKLDLRTGAVVGVEALVRWQHPTRGLLPPSEFLEIAESTGLIDPLTDWVLERALNQLAEWQARALPLSVAVAVNISARNLRDEQLPDKIFERLRAHGIAPGNLEIELTETAIIAHPGRARALLARLHDAGVRVSLDDFGQGYTSLAHLARLPLSELKIDRSFIAAMPSTRQDKTIVRTVIELGHQLGLQVVAEGAETDDAVTALAALGCDTVQGFAFTPPLTAEDTLTWKHSHAKFGPGDGAYATDTGSPAPILPTASTTA